MKYLKQYESFTSEFSEKDLLDIFNLNLEDNPYIDITDIEIKPREMYGALKDIKQYILQIDGDFISYADKSTIHAMINKIGKKYSFRILDTDIRSVGSGKDRIVSFIYPYTKQQNESVDTSLRDRVFYDLEDNIDFDITELKEVGKYTNYSDYTQHNNPDYGTYHVFESTIQINLTSNFYTPLDKASVNFVDEENSEILQEIVNSFETALRKSARKNGFIIYRGFYSRPDGKTATFIHQNDIKAGIRLSTPHIGIDSYDFKIKFVLKD